MELLAPQRALAFAALLRRIELAQLVKDRKRSVDELPAQQAL
jgi:hypothetical protein